MSLSPVKIVSLSIIRWGRWVAKVFRLENNPFVLFFYKQVLKGVVNKNSKQEKIKYWEHDFVLASDLSILPGLLNKTYEKHELDFVKNTLKPGQTFYDIGANFGLYAVLASQIVGPQGHVFAFEPAPETFKNLKTNTSALQNVSCFQCAVGSKDGTLDLYFDSRNPGCSSALAVTSGPSASVTQIKIDSYLLEKKVLPADFVKIDVEGFEWEVLQGMQLAISKNTVILCEFNPSFLKSVQKDPQAFLDFVKSRFEHVRFIEELSGQQRTINTELDLKGQIVSNLVLSGLKPAGP